MHSAAKPLTQACARVGACPRCACVRCVRVLLHLGVSVCVNALRAPRICVPPGPDCVNVCVATVHITHLRFAHHECWRVHQKQWMARHCCGNAMRGGCDVMQCGYGASRTAPPCTCAAGSR